MLLIKIQILKINSRKKCLPTDTTISHFIENLVGISAWICIAFLMEVEGDLIEYEEIKVTVRYHKLELSYENALDEYENFQSSEITKY